MFRSEDHRAYAAASESGVAGAADQGAAETWARVKRRLRAELGEDIFSSWFGRLELETVVDRLRLSHGPDPLPQELDRGPLHGSRARPLPCRDYRIGACQSSRVRSALGRDPAACRRPHRGSAALAPGPVAAGIVPRSAEAEAPVAPHPPEERSDAQRARRRAARHAPDLRQLHRRPFERARPCGRRPGRPSPERPGDLQSALPPCRRRPRQDASSSRHRPRGRAPKGGGSSI